MRVVSFEFTYTKVYACLLEVGKNRTDVIDYFTIPVSPGAYEDGIPANNGAVLASQIQKALAENKVKAKKAMVTVFDLDCKIENFSVVNVKKSQLDKIVKQELHKRGYQMGNVLFDYVILSQNESGLLDIRAAVYDKKLIEVYSNVIKKAGLTPTKFSSTEFVMELGVYKYASEECEACMFAYLNNEYLHTTQYFDGAFFHQYYDISGYIKKPDESEESFIISSNFATDEQGEQIATNVVTQNIMNLVRAFTQKNPGVLADTIYLYGDSDILEAVETSLRGIEGMQIHIPDVGIEVADEDRYNFSKYINAITANWMINDDSFPIDLFTALKKENNGEFDIRTFIPSIIMLTGLLVSIGVYTDYKFKGLAYERELESVQEYIGDSTVQQRYKEVLDITNKVSYLNLFNGQCEEYVAALMNMDRYSGATVRYIADMAPAGVEITNYSYSEDTLSLACRATDKDLPRQFVEKLSETNRYVDVSYVGFTKGAEIGGNSIYTFTIKIVLWSYEPSGGENNG